MPIDPAKRIRPIVMTTSIDPVRVSCQASRRRKLELNATLGPWGDRRTPKKTATPGKIGTESTVPVGIIRCQSMDGLEQTYDTLATTRNEAAIEVLRSALIDEDASIRLRAVVALMRRKELRCRSLVLTRWPRLSGGEKERLAENAKWLEPAIRQRLKRAGADVGPAIDAAVELQLTSVVPEIATIAAASPRGPIRDQATEATLTLTESLGRDARADRDRPTARNPILARLAEVVRRFRDHENEGLFDAFLGVVTWGDSELRHLLDADSPVSTLLVERMESSNRSAVIELVAGFIRRRHLSEGVVWILGRREDPPFRDALLRAIGNEPCDAALKNLKRIGTPACCRGGESLLDEVPAECRTPLAHVAITTYQDPIRAMHLACAAIERGAPGGGTAIAAALVRCPVPSVECWMRAAGTVAGGDANEIQKDENASLLERLIRLLDHPNPSVVRGIRRILAPLHAEQILPRFDTLRARSRRRLGRVVRRIDPSAIDRVREKLRHPVLAQRLQAIAAADALAALDQLADSLLPIVRADHQEARRRIAMLLAEADGEETLNILREMSEFPDSTARDTALEALNRRDSRRPREGHDVNRGRDEPDASPQESLR